METKVTPRPSPRILASGNRTTIHRLMPTQSVIVPVPEFPFFLALTRAVASRHQRAAVRAEQRVA